MYILYICIYTSNIYILDVLDVMYIRCYILDNYRHKQEKEGKGGGNVIVA